MMPGEHTIKMCESHSYYTFIGFSESTIKISENEDLLVQHAVPMAVNQPGNMIISAYYYKKESLIPTKQRTKKLTCLCIGF